MSLKAYQGVQIATEDPRVTEYRLFGQVTGALLNAKQANAAGAPAGRGGGLEQAGCGAPWRPTAWTTATP